MIDISNIERIKSINNLKDINSLKNELREIKDLLKEMIKN